MAAYRTYVGSVGLNVGAGIAALGLTGATWQLALFNSRGSMSSMPFWWALIAVAAAFLMMSRPAFPAATVARAVRRALAVAMPLLLLSGGFAGTADLKTAAYVATMRSDLRNLAILEQQALADSGHYTDQLGALRVSGGALAPAILVTAAGWSATVRHKGTPQLCSIFIGRQPEPPATRPGEPACTRAPLDRAVLAGALGVLALGLVIATAGSAAGRAT